jgi:hypothetical protein
MTEKEYVEWWRDIHDPGITNIEIDPANNYWLGAHTKKFNGAWKIDIVRYSWYPLPSSELIEKATLGGGLWDCLRR